jgi:hypothetical protein
VVSTGRVGMGTGVEEVEAVGVEVEAEEVGVGGLGLDALRNGGLLALAACGGLETFRGEDESIGGGTEGFRDILLLRVVVLDVVVVVAVVGLELPAPVVAEAPE